MQPFNSYFDLYIKYLTMHNIHIFFKNFVTLIILHLLISAILEAGDSAYVNKSMVYSIGYSNFRILDRQASPLIYSSASIPVEIGFQKYTDKSIFSINLILVPGLMHTKRFKTREVIYSEMDNDGNESDVTVNLKNLPIGLFEINSEYFVKTGSYFNKKILWYTGGQLQEYMVYSISLAPLYFNQLSLNPKTYIQYRVNDKSLFSSTLSFLLFSLITRMPYSRDPYTDKGSYFISFFEQGTEFETLNHYQRLDFTLTAQTRLSKHWWGGLAYQFCWYHHSEKMGLKAYSNSIQIQFTRTFTSKAN